jgi:hypothetical protein
MLVSGDSWRAGTPRFRSGGGDQSHAAPQDVRSGPGDRRSARGRGGCFNATRGVLWREKKAEEEGKEDSSGSRKRGSQEAGLQDELADSASSPCKQPSQATREGSECQCFKPATYQGEYPR